MCNNGENSYEGVLDQWKVNLIVRRARRMGFRGVGLDDALQEVVMMLRSFVYDRAKSNGAAQATVLTRWIDCKLSKLRRTESRIQKRQDHYGKLRKDAGPAPSYLNVDIKNIIGTMPEFEQNVCGLLGNGHRKAEIMQRLNCSKESLEFAMNTIRERFMDYDMDEWLRSK